MLTHLRDGSTGMRATFGPLWPTFRPTLRTKLTTMREVERMREVESEDGSPAALGQSKLTHLAQLKRRELEKECEVQFTFCGA